MTRFVGYIPEFQCTTVQRKTRLCENLYLLPVTNQASRKLRTCIEADGYKIEGGACLYFDGALTEDLSPYEVFHGYCLALGFYYVQGQATCRAVLELDNDDHLGYHIDPLDKFGVDPDDVIEFQKNDRTRLALCYERILPDLATREFNKLRNALEFYSLYLHEFQIRTRLLFLSICLESLFLEGSDAEGIGHKLGLRCAKFLNHFDDDISLSDTFYEVKIGYGLRSKIIHGGNYQKESAKAIKGTGSKATSELDHIEILEAIVKRVFHHILLQTDYYNEARAGSLGAKIDQDLVLS